MKIAFTKFFNFSSFLKGLIKRQHSISYMWELFFIQPSFSYYHIRYGEYGFLEKFSISFSQKVFFVFFSRLIALLKGKDLFRPSIISGFRVSSFFKNKNSEIFIFLPIFKRSTLSLKMYYFSLFFLFSLNGIFSLPRKIFFALFYLTLSFVLPFLTASKFLLTLVIKIFDFIIFGLFFFGEKFTYFVSIWLWFNSHKFVNQVFYHFTTFYLYFFSFTFKFKHYKNFHDFEKRFSAYKKLVSESVFFSLLRFKTYFNWFRQTRPDFNIKINKTRAERLQLFIVRYFLQTSRAFSNPFAAIKKTLFKLNTKRKPLQKKSELKSGLVPIAFRVFFIQPFFFFNTYLKTMKTVSITKFPISYFQFYNFFLFRTFYLNFFTSFLSFKQRRKIHFSIISLFGVFPINFNFSQQQNFFKIFILFRPLRKFSEFFVFFKHYSKYFQNDFSFFVFSNPHIFNFFFPVFTNVFIDSIVQDAALYDSHRSLYNDPSLLESDDDEFEDEVDHYEFDPIEAPVTPPQSFSSKKSKLNRKSSPKPDTNKSELLSTEDFDPNQLDRVERAEFSKDRNLFSSYDDDDEDFSLDEEPLSLADPDDVDETDFYDEDYEHGHVTDRWARRNNKALKGHFRYTTDHDLELSATVLMFYAEIMSELPNINSQGHLAHSNNHNFPVNLHELFYQYYFSRFYGSYNIDMFFYSFIFPYAFKNFSISFKTAKIFNSLFFSFSNKIYVSYFSIFYISPFLNFVTKYFQTDFYKNPFSFSLIQQKVAPYFYFSSLFFKFKFFPILKNFFYGYFKFASKTNLLRDLNYYNTYSRLYDLKQGEIDTDDPASNVSVDLSVVEDEDENTEYVNHFFIERLDESQEEDLSDDLFDSNSDDLNFEIYVYSDDFIEPFLTDDEFQKSIEYSITQDDSILDPRHYANFEQLDFEIPEATLSEMLIQNAYMHFLEAFFSYFPIVSNKAFVNHIDPISDIDFTINDDGPDFQDDLYDRSNQMTNADEDIYRQPTDKKSLILIKNIAQLYNDRTTKWLVKNKNLNLKPLPPFLYGIGKYLPNHRAAQFFKFSDLQSLYSNPNYYRSVTSRLSGFKYDYQLKDSKFIFDKNFLRNFLIAFQSPIHLYPADAHLSIFIVFNILVKSFQFDFKDFLSKNEFSSESYFLGLGGLLFQLILLAESDAVGIHETLNLEGNAPFDQELEIDVIFTLRTFSPRILSILRSKYSYFVYDSSFVTKNSKVKKKKGELETPRNIFSRLRKLRNYRTHYSQDFSFLGTRDVRAGFVQSTDIIEDFFDNLHNVNPGLLYQYNKISSSFFRFLNRYVPHLSVQRSRPLTDYSEDVKYWTADPFDLQEKQRKKRLARMGGVDYKEKKPKFDDPNDEEDDEDNEFDENFYRETSNIQPYWIRKYISLRRLYKPFIKRRRIARVNGERVKKFKSKFPLFNLPFFKIRYTATPPKPKPKKRKVRARIRRIQAALREKRMHRYGRDQKKFSRRLSKLYKFFKLDLTSVYDTNPYISKSTSFFELFYFVNYSLFYAFYHMIEDFFFYYSLLQTSIPKQYRITPKIYQSFSWNLRAKNTYDIFNTYYSNYLFHIYPNKISQTRNLFSRKDFLDKFGYSPEKHFYTRLKKLRKEQKKFIEKNSHLYPTNTLSSEDFFTNHPVIETNYSFQNDYLITKETRISNHLFKALDKPFEFDPSYYTDIILTFQPRPFIQTRLKFSDNHPYYHYNHTASVPTNKLFEVDETEFFYTAGDNPFPSFFFTTNLFSFFRSFDIHLQPYQYTFPLGTYFFDINFYPEDEMNTDFNIFDFYMLSDQDELLDDNERDPVSFDSDISDNESPDEPYEARDLNVEFDSANFFVHTDNVENYDRETADGTNDIETSEYDLDAQDLEFGSLDEDLDIEFQDDEDEHLNPDLYGRADTYFEPDDVDYHVDEVIDPEDIEEDTFLDRYFDTDLVYGDQFDDWEFFNPDTAGFAGNYHNTFYQYDSSFSDPFLFSTFYKYKFNPKQVYPASTFLHYPSRLINRKKFKNFYKKLEERYKLMNRYSHSRKFRIELVDNKIKKKHYLKYRNSKYYRRYTHFAKLLNNNSPFYTSSFPVYNFYDIDFQFYTNTMDYSDFAFWGLESAHEGEIIPISYRQHDYRTFLDQENDDLDPDFFDFALYTSVPIARFFFGYAKSRAYPFTISDPRFVANNSFEFKFINQSTFAHPFTPSSTSLRVQEHTPKTFNFTFHPILKVLLIQIVKLFLTIRLFFIYSILYNKPEFMLSNAYDLIISHHYSYSEIYSSKFFQKYYTFLEIWNKHLTSFTLSSLKFDYFKNLFNPIFYTSTGSNFSPYTASKLSLEPDSEYLHLDFFIETHLYTSLIANEKVERILKDRIKMPLFFWNYDEYFLQILNVLDEFEFRWNSDTRSSMLLPHIQNLNTDSSDQFVDLTDVYEELFDNLKNVYLSRIEIFLDAVGQLIFIWFFSFFSILKIGGFKVKTFFATLRLYNELNWIQLYLQYGPIVNLFRTVFALSFFVFFIFYAFFNLPYFVFYFYPFLSNFSLLLINSIFLGFAFVLSAYICFKNFRFFLKSLDEYERFAFFGLGAFLWFYNVYLGYLKNPTFQRLDPYAYQFYELPSLNWLAEQSDETSPQRTYYRRSQYFPHTAQFPDPLYRYSDSKFLITGSALDMNSIHSYLFRDKTRPDYIPGYTQPRRFFGLSKFVITYPFTYHHLLQTFSNPRKNSVRLIAPNSTPFSAHANYTNRFRRVGSSQKRLSRLHVPLSNNSNFLLEPNFFPRPNLFPIFNIYDPLNIRSLRLMTTYYLRDKSYDNVYRDYVYYPFSKRIRPLLSNRNLRTFRLKHFRTPVSYRMGVPKRTIMVHDDPLFRQFINKPDWYSPHTWYTFKPHYFNPIADYFRQSYFRTWIGRYYKGSARGAGKFLRKRFQNSPINYNKRLKFKILGNSKRFLQSRRFDLPARAQRFTRFNPYVYTVFRTQDPQYNPQHIYKYSAFEKGLPYSDQFSAVFSDMSLRSFHNPKTYSRIRVSSGSLGLDKINKTYMNFRRSNKSYKPRIIETTSEFNSFVNSATQFELEKRLSASFYFTKNLPVLLTYYDSLRSGSVNFTKRYKLDLARRFRTLQNKKLKSTKIPPHYKFSIFFSPSFAESFNFFQNRGSISRSNFNFSTLLTGSFLGSTSTNNAARFIRYRRRSNILRKFFQLRNQDRFNQKSLFSALLNLDQSFLETYVTINVSNKFLTNSAFGSAFDFTQRSFYNNENFDSILLNLQNFRDHPSFVGPFPDLVKSPTSSAFSNFPFYNQKFINPHLLDSKTPNYYPTTLVKFLPFLAAEQAFVHHQTKRARDAMVFRYWFLKFVNNRKRFISNFTSSSVLPLYSSSNYLNATLFNLLNSDLNSNRADAGYPVFDPYYLASIYPEPARVSVQKKLPKYPTGVPFLFKLKSKPGSDFRSVPGRNRFVQQFSITGSAFSPFQNSKDFPVSFTLLSNYQTSFSQDNSSTLKLRKFYMPGNTSYTRFQRNTVRFRYRRYRPNLIKIFERRSRRAFSLLSNDYSERIMSKQFKKLNKSIREHFQTSRLKSRRIFSSSYHNSLHAKRASIINRYRADPKRRITMSERKFVKNRLNRKNSLVDFSDLFKLENSLIVRSAFSKRIRIKHFKNYGFYGLRDLKIKLFKFSPSCYPFDTKTDLARNLKKQRKIFPSKYRVPKQVKLTKERRIFFPSYRPAYRTQYPRRIPEKGPNFRPPVRPSAHQYPLFKSVRHKRPAFHYRSYYFITKYINIL